LTGSALALPFFDAPGFADGGFVVSVAAGLAAGFAGFAADLGLGLGIGAAVRAVALFAAGLAVLLSGAFGAPCAAAPVATIIASTAAKTRMLDLTSQDRHIVWTLAETVDARHQPERMRGARSDAC
jgi:hypothetical protein